MASFCECGKEPSVCISYGRRIVRLTVRAVRTRRLCLLMVPKSARSENFPFVGTKVQK